MTLDDVMFAFAMEHARQDELPPRARDKHALAAALKHVANHLDDLGHGIAAAEVRAVIGEYWS